MKEVIWSRTAQASLKETVEFIEKLWNTEVSEEFLSQLDFRVEQIQRNPELAPKYKSSEFRRLLIHKNVSLFYRNQSKFIRLLLIWNNRQNPKQLLQQVKIANMQ